jgi:fructose-1,6-bisphosphatase I
MTRTPQSLVSVLQETDSALAQVILAVADACAQISARVARGPLEDILGSAGSSNVQGETQKALDVIANQMLVDAAKACPQIAGVASEEEDDIVAFAGERGDHLLLFDPLDGSSNIDVNASIGTIFSILPATSRPVKTADFLQPGRSQRAAGYVIYGPQTLLVLSTGGEVQTFCLDPRDGQWTCVASDLTIPRATKEFAINMSNQRHWAAPVQRYIAECLAGSTGPRGKDFNMRWIASMVADVHRVLSRGGVFLYPWDQREPDRAGKLRLLYEANPLGFLVERAGGLAHDGKGAILDIQPVALHQRVAVMLGAAEEVQRLAELHAA